MRALLLSLPLVLFLSLTAHAADYSARADQRGNVQVQDATGAWLPLYDSRTRAKGGVVHIPPGIDPFDINNSLDLQEISFDFDGWRYFVLHID